MRNSRSRRGICYNLGRSQRSASFSLSDLRRNSQPFPPSSFSSMQKISKRCLHKYTTCKGSTPRTTARIVLDRDAALARNCDVCISMRTDGESAYSDALLAPRRSPVDCLYRYMRLPIHIYRMCLCLTTVDENRCVSLYEGRRREGRCGRSMGLVGRIEKHTRKCTSRGGNERRARYTRRR